MARFTYDPTRLNYTVEQKGKEYNLRLLQRSQSIFTTLLNLLPSNYVSSVQGPNYTNELKAVAVELARIELALEDIDSDRDFSSTRSEFLYSIVGYLLLVNNKVPPLQFSDEEFRKFLVNLIRMYFQGSVPRTMQDVVQQFMSGDVQVTEDFLLVRKGASGLDISDQFVFGLDIPAGAQGFPPDVFGNDSATRQILDLMRPAHTLFRIRYIFNDKYIPNDQAGRILDAMQFDLSVYYYEDFRAYWNGIRNRDRLGVKSNQIVVGEDHSNDF